MFNKTDIERKFFEEKNFNRLMKYLFDYFQDSYKYRVGKDEEELCVMMMNTVYSHEEPGAGETRISFLKRINKICMSRMITMISSKLDELMNTKDDVRDDILIERGDEVQSNALNFPRAQMNHKGSMNGDVGNHYDMLMKERSGETKEEVLMRPKFEKEMEESNEDVFKAFEETQRKFEEDRKNYEMTQKIVSKNGGTEMIIKDADDIPSGPTAANIDNDGDKLIMDNNELISKKDLEENKLIIPQPPQFKKVIQDIYDTKTKNYNMVVDSRDRNHDLYPNPNNYQIEIDNELRDILAIELISAELPAVQYNINENNNLLYFNEGGDTLIASVEVGQYDDVNVLAAAITTALNSADDSSGDYSVSVSSLTRKFTLTKGSGTFNLEFLGDNETFVHDQTRSVYKEKNLGPVIGFSRRDLSGQLSYTGDNQYNINGETYILMYIKELENMESVSGNKTIHDSFTKINIGDKSSNNIKFYTQLNEYISRVTFTPPLMKLSQMIIKFYNYDGSYYDFGGREHSLFFKIETFNQPKEYFQG